MVRIFAAHLAKGGAARQVADALRRNEANAEPYRLPPNVVVDQFDWALYDTGDDGIRTRVRTAITALRDSPTTEGPRSRGPSSWPTAFHEMIADLDRPPPELYEPADAVATPADPA